MVLKLHVGDPELDRDDWYQRVRAALRGLTKDGQVDMLNLNRFRLAEDEGTVTWKLNVRFFFDLHATGSSVSQTRWTDWRESGDSRGCSRRRARRRSVLVLR